MELKELKDINKESGIIATVLYNPDFVFHSGSLSYTHFYDKTNGAIYWGVKSLVESGVFEIDSYNLFNILNTEEAKRNKFPEVTVDYIKNLFDYGQYIFRTNPADYKLLVKEVQNLALRREMCGSLEIGKQMCLNMSDKNEDVQAKVYELIEGVNKEFAFTKDIKRFGEKLPKIWNEIEKRQNGEYASIPTKFPAINKYVELEPGELILFGAYAKVGKSAMLLSETVDLLKKGKTVLVIDSELSDKLYTARIIAHVSKVPFKVVKDGGYTQQQREEIDKATKWLEEVNLYHEYMPVFNDYELLTMIKRVNAMSKIDVVVVDYFKINTSGNAYEVSNAMASTVDMIKNEVCGAMGISGLGAVQCTKSGEVALSSGIVRNCSTLITLVRKDAGEIAQDGPDCGNTKAVVKFNRNGPQHSDEEYIDLLFTGDLLDYSESNQHIEVKPY